MTCRRPAGKALIVVPNLQRAIERREALIDNAVFKPWARRAAKVGTVARTNLRVRF